MNPEMGAKLIVEILKTHEGQLDRDQLLEEFMTAVRDYGSSAAAYEVYKARREAAT